MTDPDVRVMRNQKGYVAGYNGQLVVTADQVIAGAMLSQHPVDRTLLHPLLDTCHQQLTEAGIKLRLRTVLADSGYVSEETFARADADGLRLLAPLAKDPGKRRTRTPQRALHLDRPEEVHDRLTGARVSAFRSCASAAGRSGRCAMSPQPAAAGAARE